MTTTIGNFQRFLVQSRNYAIGAGSSYKQSLADEPLLNGTPAKAFREAIPLELRREKGTFFTSLSMGEILVDQIRHPPERYRLVMDPTCGMGDLLLAFANKLPLKETLQATINEWGSVIAGVDQNPALVEMAKIRLSLLARYRGGFRESLLDLDDIFPLIQVGDFFSSRERLREPDLFLFNPPFAQCIRPSDTKWGQGLVNSAAIFLEFLIAAKSSESEIVALLPEVLRCGSRYRRFRAFLEEAGVHGKFTSLGRFDRWADVDVYVSSLRSDGKGRLWETPSIDGDVETVEQHFDVKVGSVVPHRDPEIGYSRRYICARSTPAWSQGFVPTLNRKYRGAVFKPPFVAVRRTSRSDDKVRAVGAVVLGARPVAVENHLIVLTPLDGQVDTCRRLLRLLEQPSTSDFLNRTIRCRHLTVGAVKQIPWGDPDA